MNKFKKLLKGGLVVVMAASIAVSVAACGSEKEPSVPEVPAINVAIGAVDSVRVRKGDEIQLTATVTGAENTAVTWSVSDTNFATISANGLLTITRDQTTNKKLVVTATSVEDKTRTASTTFEILAPVIDGQIGLLTSEMIEAVGNDSITVTGTITDHYVDLNASYNSVNRTYDMKVMMEAGKWYGEWRNQPTPGDISVGDAGWVKNLYQQSDEDVTDSNGETGKGLAEVYIGKDNTVVSKLVTNYMSTPALWASQHYYNHLAQLDVNKFEQVSVDNDKQYMYKVDVTSEESLYLMTYFSFSLTPLLSDTLDRIILEVDEETQSITKILGQTETLYDGGATTSAEEASSISYTTIELTVSDVGTTTVPTPTPYEAPDHADALQAALNKMKTAKNYTFEMVDKMTNAPTGGEGDYNIESVSGGASAFRSVPFAGEAGDAATKPTIGNHSTASGTAGIVGWITEDAILFAETTEYTSSMDNLNFRREYWGYKPNADASYDMFEYDSTDKVFKGVQRINGNMADTLATFDFSPNVFEYVGSSKDGYIFELREGTISRDIAMEVCMDTIARSAVSSSSTPVRITVDANGNLTSTRFAYSLNGVYSGYCTTTFKDFGTTDLNKIDANLFAGYVPRAYKTAWSDYMVNDYYPNHSTTGGQQSIAADQLIAQIYPKCTLPTPKLFLDLFGDTLGGPFFDWDEREDGTYMDILSITLKISDDEVDENLHLTKAKAEEWVEKIKTAMKAEGFEYSPANSDLSGLGYETRSSVFAFVGNGLIIRVEMNNTRFFWFDFYKQGDWTLRR